MVIAATVARQWHQKTISDGVDPASSYEIRYRARVIDNLHRHAKAFGFVLQPTAPVAVS